MAYNTFVDGDKLSLLSNPGVLSYRAKGSLGAYTKALFANGAAYAKSTEVSTVSFDDVGDVEDQVSKETVEVSISTGRVLDLDFLAAVSGGLAAVTNTPGAETTTSPAQRIPSGSWNYNKFIMLSGQNASKAKQTIVSVVGSTDGALAVAVDYDQVDLPDVGWGIIVKDSSKVTTELQYLDVTYTYTPLVSKILKTGGVKTITPLELKFETIDAANKVVTYNFYNCYPDGNIGHGFSPENSAEPATMDLKFVAKVDTSSDPGDQLFNVTITG